MHFLFYFSQFRSVASCWTSRFLQSDRKCGANRHFSSDDPANSDLFCLRWFENSWLTLDRRRRPAGNILEMPNWWTASLTADCNLMSNSLPFSIGIPSVCVCVARQHSLIGALQNRQCWLGDFFLFLSDRRSRLLPPSATVFNRSVWNCQDCNYSQYL